MGVLLTSTAFPRVSTGSTISFDELPNVQKSEKQKCFEFQLSITELRGYRSRENETTENMKKFFGFPLQSDSKRIGSDTCQELFAAR